MLKERLNRLRNGSDMKLDTSAIQAYPDRYNISRRLLDRDLLASFDPVCSHVIDHVYVGSVSVARNRETLTENGITHVLNSAGYACPEYFPEEFKYKTLWLKDSPSEDISSILYIVFDFIEEVRHGGGRVFVHCCKGVSRSTSLVIAYLMWLQSCTFQDAFNFVKAARGVTNPNLGFACQLLQFQKQLQNGPAIPNSKLRVYRMASHSPHDPLLLVPKKVTGSGTSAFDSRGSFVIHGKNSLFVWQGIICNARMAVSAHEFALQLIRYERARGPVIHVDEDEEPSEFLEVLQTGSFSRTNSDVSSIGDMDNQKVEDSSVGVTDSDKLWKSLEGLHPGDSDAKHEDSATLVDSHNQNELEEPETGNCLASDHQRNAGKSISRLKTLSLYDKDFDLFERAKAEQLVPSPLSSKDNGWRRLRGRFCSGSDIGVCTGSEGSTTPTP